MVTKRALILVLGGLSALAGTAQGQTTAGELAGNSLSFFPHFEYVTAFNTDAGVEVAIDPSRFDAGAGETVDIYVVDAQDTWSDGDPLNDAGSGAETLVLGASLVDNRVEVASPGELDFDAGVDLGVPYDVVVDRDGDGQYTAGLDLLDDGGAGRAGLYVVKDLVEPGPLATSVIDYEVDDVTPGDESQRTWYPTNLVGQLPLIVIGHGNGHDYDWYDYLQEHLASHGYIVMSHENNTGAGIEAASTTTLEHTDAILAQQDVIGGGVLDGHIDSSRIVWIGHSRGGEGITRAFDRLFDGDYVPAEYGQDDIVLISSIAPTDFLGTGDSTAHGAPHHLLYGSADGDVCGCPNNNIAQAFLVYERAEGERRSTYVHGADHNDFNCCGFNDFDGPGDTEIGRSEAQRVAKAAYLALIELHLEGNVPAKDYLWRQYERFKPIGVASDTIVVSEFKDGPDSGKFVIDDYQSNFGTGTSSSGGAVFVNVTNLEEGILDDNDGSFEWTPSDPFNGMTRARPTDSTRGAVFDADGVGDRWIGWEVVPAARDFTAWDYLSFRAAQGTRHPLTTSRLADESWAVVLRDGDGNLAFVDFGVYGGGIEEPYQRTGYGTGAGWQNEMETIRIRIQDFAADGRDIDLTNITGVAFMFRGLAGRPSLRVGVDDLELTLE